MTVRIPEASPRVYGRVAGFLYLAVIVFGIFAEVVVRSRLIVPGDAAATASSILASAWLYRLGFAADAIMLLSDVALAVLFYVLLKPVSKTLALAAAAFRLTQAAILGTNLLNYHAALVLLGGAGYSAAFATDQLYALVMFFLDMHSHGYDLGLLFFGVSTIILGYLVVRSGYIPAILGYGLTVAGVVYLGGSCAVFLFPGSLPLIEPMYILPLVAELAFCAWLLARGVRMQP